MQFLDLLREPALEVKLYLPFEVRDTTEGKVLAIAHEGNVIPVARHDPTLAAALEHLYEGAQLGAVRDQVLAQADAGVAGRFLALAQTLAQYNALFYQQVGARGPFSMLAPQARRFAPSRAPVAGDDVLVLSRFALVRRYDQWMMLESPLAKVRVVLNDPAAGTLVLALGRTRRVEPLLAEVDLEVREDAQVFLELLMGCGFLVQGEEGVVATHLDEGGTTLAQWEFQDLLLHMRCSRGRTADAFGSFYPFVNQIDPPPAVRPPWTGDPIPLAKPDIGELVEADPPFTAVQEWRRSIRDYDEDNPITKEQIGMLLYRSARIKRMETHPVRDGVSFEFTHRPFPTGGASYELEIYLTVDRSADLARGFYHYDAQAHTLTLIREPDQSTADLLEHAYISTARLARPQVLLTIAARFSRVMWKYRAISYSTILRDVGALYQTLYLVATAMRIAPCAAGSTEVDAFERASGLDPVEEGAVGTFLIGSVRQPAA